MTYLYIYIIYRYISYLYVYIKIIIHTYGNPLWTNKDFILMEIPSLFRWLQWSFMWHVMNRISKPCSWYLEKFQIPKDAIVKVQRTHNIYIYIVIYVCIYIYICAFQDVRTNIWIRKYIYFLKSSFDICIYLFTICIFSFNEYRYFRVSQAEASHSTITHTQ